jgi:hypothetical protein
MLNSSTRLIKTVPAMIDTSLLLLKKNRVVLEPIIANKVGMAVSKIWADKNVLASYTSFFGFLDNTKIKVNLAESLLAANALDSVFLQYRAREAMSIGDDQAYRVVNLILAQKAVNADILREVAIDISSSHGPCAPKEFALIALIESSPLITDEIKGIIQQGRCSEQHRPTNH